jgi:hypothetical protein
MGNLTNDNRRAGRISYEEYEEVVPCSQLALSSLAGRRETVKNADGSVTEGVWRWWISDRCRSPELDRLREQANMVRALEGKEALLKCPMPDIPGVTCHPKFYPELTLYADGGARLQSWVWSPYSDKGRSDLHRQAEVGNIYFTPDEWIVYQLLSDDNFLRSLEPGMAVAIYYSVLQWRCAGGMAPVLEPSVVSPQSLAGKHDTGSQYWLEFYERSLRERLWKIRTDLRSIRLPDGQVVPGLRDPKEVEVRPHCTSSTGKIIMGVFSAITAVAGLALSWPSWISLLYQLPLGVADFVQQIKAGKLTRRAVEAVEASQTGKPSGPPVTAPQPPADPTGLTGRANGMKPPAPPSGAAGSLLVPLAIAAAIALAG